MKCAYLGSLTVLSAEYSVLASPSRDAMCSVVSIPHVRCRGRGKSGLFFAMHKRGRGGFRQHVPPQRPQQQQQRQAQHVVVEDKAPQGAPVRVL